MLDHTGGLIVVARRENLPLLIVEVVTHSDTTVICHDSRLFLCPLKVLMFAIYVFKTFLSIDILTFRNLASYI